ncbi:hypothetical protein ACLKA7_003001 [Drosophila subpalustris]
MKLLSRTLLIRNVGSDDTTATRQQVLQQQQQQQQEVEEKWGVVNQLPAEPHNRNHRFILSTIHETKHDTNIAKTTQISDTHIGGFGLIPQTIVHDVICLLLLLQRVPRENANKEISQQLKRLQRIYRYRYRYRDRQLELKLERIYLLKNCLIWMLIVFLLSFMLINYGVISVDFESPILGRIWVVLKVMIVDGEDVIMHMHFMLTWRFCRLYMCLNSRIGELIKTNDATVTLEMHHLRWQHYQLTKLLERLNVPYNFTLIIIRFFLIVTAVALGYYLIIFHSLEYHLIYTLSAVALYTVFFLSCYMLDMLYDLTKKSHRETSWQLRQINELANPDKQFSRAV